MNKPQTPQIRFKGFTDEWQNNPLQSFAIIYGGLTYSPNNVIDKGTLVLRSSNIKDNRLVNADDVFVSPNVVNVDNVQIGDIVMVVRNGSKALIGKHAVVKFSMPNTVIGAFMAGIKTEFPYFNQALFETSAFNFEVNKNSGATINQITSGMFRNMFFIVPTKNEQREIGMFFNQLDELISEVEREIVRLEKMKLASLQKMFPRPGTTTPEIRFAGFSTPWCIKHIGNIFSEGNARGCDGLPLSVSIIRGVYPTEDFTKTVTVKDFNNYKKVAYGDIVYNSMRMWQGASGVSYWNGFVSPAYTVLVPIEKENICSEFFAYLFKLEWVIKIFEATSQGLTKDTWNLKYPAISKIALPIPSDVEEQRAIVQYFRNLDELTSAKRQKLAKLRNIKKSCLDKMFVSTSKL